MQIQVHLLGITTGVITTKTSERKRPCSGLVKVIAHQKPPKTKKQTPKTARVIDRIGGLCVAFPFHSPICWTASDFLKGSKRSTIIEILLYNVVDFFNERMTLLLKAEHEIFKRILAALADQR